MFFFLINGFLIVFIIFLLIILSWTWPPDSPWSPWWRTNSKKSLMIARLAKITSDDIVYEIGSGEAEFLVAVVKKIGCRGVGIEIDPFRTLVAKLQVIINGLNSKIKLHRGNFFNYKISQASVVYLYLVPRVLEKLKPKMIRELKKGTKVISNRYKLEPHKNLKLVTVKNKVYFYKIV